MATDSTEARDIELIKWAEAVGIESHKMLFTRDNVHRGVSLKAAEDFEPGVIFRIPIRAAINTRSILRMPEYETEATWKALLAAQGKYDDLEVHEITAAFLLHEFGKGEKSYWAPYFKFLAPESPQTCFWSDEDLNELQASPVYKLTKETQADQAVYWAGLEKLIKDNPTLFDEKIFNQNNFSWADAVVWSRSFNDEMDGMEVIHILPVLDFINHNPDRVVDWRVNEELGTVDMEVEHAYKAGEEIEISYGQVNNHKLLRWYGFAIPNNPHDAIGVPLSDPAPTDPILAKKQAMLKGHKGLSKYTLKKEKMSPNFLAYARAATLTPAEYALVSQSGFDRKPPPGMVTCDNERRAVDFLINDFQAFLKQYPTTYEEDEKILSETKEPKKSFAIVNRMSEKNLVLTHLETLKKLRQELDTCTDPSLPLKFASPDRKRKARMKTYEHKVEL